MIYIPYNNVPKHLWPKMESCIKDLKAKGKDEQHAIAICYSSIVGKIDEFKGGENMENEIKKAVWSTAYENDLPDASFAYIEAGGKKDSSGKTTPRSLRHLPYKDKNGKPDAAHVRNALARLNQTNISAAAKASAKAKLIAAAKQLGIEVSDSKKIDTMEGGEKIMTDTKDVKEADESTEVKEEVIEKATPQMKDGDECVMPDGKTKGAIKGGKCMIEEKKADKVDKADEPPVEEKVEEKVEEPVVEEKPAEVTPEPKTEEVVEEVKEEVKVEEAKPIETPVEEPKEEVKEEVKADGEPLKAILESLEALTKKVDELSTIVKKAPAEGASDVETPKKEVEQPKEEVKKSEAAVEETKEEPKVEEPKEEVKAETVVEKAEDKGTSSEGAILEALKDLKKRLESLENSPAPSKVVVNKGFGTSLSEDDGDASLKKITDRLSEIAKIKDANPSSYTEGLANEAFNLVKEKKALIAKMI